MTVDIDALEKTLAEIPPWKWRVMEESCADVVPKLIARIRELEAEKDDLVSILNDMENRDDRVRHD